MWNAPRRWTSTTAFISSSVMLAKLRSRRIPALEITMSTDPKLSIAVRTVWAACSGSATDP